MLNHVPAAESPDWIPYATVGRPHGIRGAFYLRADDRRTEPDSYTYLMIEHAGQRLVYRVQQMFKSGTGVVVSLEGVASRSQAELLVGARVFCHRSEVEDTAEDEYLVADLVGCSVFFENEQLVGTVVNIVSFGAQENLEIELLHSKDSIFYPFIDPYVVEVDVAAKRIVVQNIPEFFGQ